MVNKPKQAGTAAESAVAAFLVTQGWPYAERRSLAGALDKGDITGTPGLCWEVKATSCAHEKVGYSGFLKECETERINATADYGIVVVKLKGYGNRRVGDWVTVMYAGDYEDLAFGLGHGLGVLVASKSDIRPQLSAGSPRVVFRPPGQKENWQRWHSFMLLSEMTQVLQKAGYGGTGSTGTRGSGTSFVDSAPASRSAGPIG